MRKNYDHKRLFGCDEELNKIVAKGLREKRDSLGLSQIEVAKRMGVSQATISGIEKARDNLTLTKLVRYVSALKPGSMVKFAIDTKTINIMLTSSKQLPIQINPQLPFGSALAQERLHASADSNSPHNMPSTLRPFFHLATDSILPNSENHKTIPAWPQLAPFLFGKGIGCHGQLPLYD